MKLFSRGTDNLSHNSRQVAKCSTNLIHGIAGAGFTINDRTIQDLYNIVGNKIANEAQKALIRNNFPPQIAEQMCNAIDGQERAEHFQRLLREYNEWMQNQQRQQEAVRRFLREYYH